MDERIERLDRLGRLAEKAEQTYIGVTLLNYELDRTPLKWKKKAINLYEH